MTAFSTYLRAPEGSLVRAMAEEIRRLTYENQMLRARGLTMQEVRIAASALDCPPINPINVTP
ncbi:hypothetical protein FGG78_20040 [Thioclava sp. BHET1]|nr:hypothetical protein FGG78_20040 [Thioclava sp. BHET1]